MEQENHPFNDDTDTGPSDSGVALSVEQNVLRWDERTWGTNILNQ